MIDDVVEDTVGVPSGAIICVYPVLSLLALETGGSENQPYLRTFSHLVTPLP